MRQKDVGKVAVILEREMRFAMPPEVEGLRTAIGAIRADLAWSQPELDLSPLDKALNTQSIAGCGVAEPPLLLGGD